MQSEAADPVPIVAHDGAGAVAFLRQEELRLCRCLAERTSPARSRRYVFLVWTGATFVTAAAAVLGFGLFTGGDVERGWMEAFAAGALIAFVVETMTPEAVDGHPGFTVLLAMLGFSALLLAL